MPAKWPKLKKPAGFFTSSDKTTTTTTGDDTRLQIGPPRLPLLSIFPRVPLKPFDAPLIVSIDFGPSLEVFEVASLVQVKVAGPSSAQDARGEARADARLLDGRLHEEHDGLKWQRTNFEPTPPLSTYIIALIVHDFGSRFELTKRGVKIGVYARKELMPYTETALEAGLMTVPALEKLTGVNYPLSKLDIFAIPDFAAGAMENWGIMTFRESKVPYSYYDILDMFSEQVYPKAAYGIYTMFTTLGEERFGKMIKGYLEKHRMGSSVTADIWEEDPIKDDRWQLARDANEDHNRKNLSGLARHYIYEDLFSMARDGVVPYEIAVSFLDDLDKEPFPGARSVLVGAYNTIKDRILDYSTSHRAHDIMGNASVHYQRLVNRAEAKTSSNNNGRQLRLKAKEKAESRSRFNEHDEIQEFNDKLWERDRLRSLGRQLRDAEEPKWRRFEREVMSACPGEKQQTSKCSKYGWGDRSNGYSEAIQSARGQEAERIAAFMWKKLEIETDLDEQFYLNRALLVAPNWEWAERMLDHLINNTGLARLQSTSRMAQTVGWRPEAFEWLYNNIGSIHERLSYEPDERKSLVENMLGQLRGRDALTKLIMMRQHPDLPEDLRPLPFWEDLAERQRLKIEWCQKYAFDLLELFAKLPQSNRQ
ncbi:unnamed protein product, partial [Mesorhabditis spiculigera]